ncbi:hypothetical protein [Burkholderia sp. PAMC 26561]|uniref:hypothetical protein n=1 Tax=Burkholderia sp. PAMC 26561 TaxID=1795043 RepID=UPI0007825AF1|nr:hypothetical protein [Burkholderia sp. PAMC 26561]
MKTSATALDTPITHCLRTEQSRATADVGIGVCIESCEGDRELRNALVGTGRFELSEKAQWLY